MNIPMGALNAHVRHPITISPTRVFTKYENNWRSNRIKGIGRNIGYTTIFVSKIIKSRNLINVFYR